jgi:hypothetical protein
MKDELENYLALKEKVQLLMDFIESISDRQEQLDSCDYATTTINLFKKTL